MKGPFLYKRIAPRAVPFHYAWIVAGAAGIVGLVNASVRLTFGVFLDPLVEEFGWSRGATSLAFSIQFIAIGVFGVWTSWIAERYGIRRTMLLGTVLFVLGMVLTGVMKHLWEFYLYYGVVLGASMSIFSTPVITLVTLWFKKKMGLGMGLVWGIQGLGPVIMAPVLGYAISAFSWQGAFYVTGVAGGLITLLVALLIRDHPAAMGLAPYGQSDVPAGVNGDKAATASPKIDEGQFFREVSRTSAFWLLIAVHFLGCVSHSIIVVHGVSMATHSGVPSLAAAGVLSVLVATSVGGRFGMSVLTDFISPKSVIAWSIGLQSVSILALFWTSDLWAFYLFAAVFGVGYGGEMVGFPVINRRFYGSAPVGRVYGYQMLGAGLGMALGGWLGGVTFDMTHSYTLGIAIAAVTGFAGMALVFPVKTPVKRAAEVSLA